MALRLLRWEMSEPSSLAWANLGRWQWGIGPTRLHNAFRVKYWLLSMETSLILLPSESHHPSRWRATRTGTWYWMIVSALFAELSSFHVLNISICLRPVLWLGFFFSFYGRVQLVSFYYLFCFGFFFLLFSSHDGGVNDYSPTLSLPTFCNISVKFFT